MEGYLYKSILEDEVAFCPVKGQVISYVELRRYDVKEKVRRRSLIQFTEYGT